MINNMKTNYIFIALAMAAALSCSKDQPQEPTAYDYSINSNWMVKTDDPTQDVDLFFIYPTCVMTGNKPSADLSESEKASALNSYIGSAYCMNEFTNAYAPYYRQTSLDYAALNCPQIDDYLRVLRENVNKKDVFAALDYYFEHFNNGRPFILASHSQGSAMTRIVLDEYMPQHPDRYARMIAAYAIGYSYPKQWMANNNIKGAAKADDYGVVVTWNTEGPNPTKSSALVTSDDYCINPLTWSTDSGYAGSDQNQGSLVWDDKTQNKFHIQKPGLADAQINSSRVSLTCTTMSDYIVFEGDPFGDKSLHGYDWSAYIENIKENAQVRIAAYKKAKNAN